MEKELEAYLKKLKATWKDNMSGVEIWGGSLEPSSNIIFNGRIISVKGYGLLNPKKNILK